VRTKADAKVVGIAGLQTFVSIAPVSAQSTSPLQAGDHTQNIVRCIGTAGMLSTL
jgi:hypothetical protein